MLSLNLHVTILLIDDELNVVYRDVCFLVYAIKNYSRTKSLRTRPPSTSQG